jgi:hypothetical protein
VLHGDRQHATRRAFASLELLVRYTSRESPASTTAERVARVPVVLQNSARGSPVAYPSVSWPVSRDVQPTTLPAMNAIILQLWVLNVDAWRCVRERWVAALAKLVHRMRADQVSERFGRTLRYYYRDAA